MTEAEQIQALRTWYKRTAPWNEDVASLDAPVTETPGETRTLADLLVVEDDDSLTQAHAEAVRDVAAGLSKIDTRLALVICMTFGFGWTFEVAGSVLGVSKQRAEQLQAKALAELRAVLAGHPAAEFVPK